MKLGAVIGALRVVFGADTAAFEKGSTKAERQMAKTEKSFKRSAAKMQRAGKAMSLAITAPLAVLVSKSLGAGVAHAEAVAQVEAGLKSMGDASGQSLDKLKQNALALEGASTFNADKILGDVTANMLTFGNVADEQFDRAQMAVIDMSTRLKTDLKSSAILAGKALNDPIAGLSALSRVGITFTDQQKAQIKAMTEAGNVAAAQSMILDELERQYGGSAKAQRDAAPGSYLTDQWRQFQRIIGAVALKVLPPLTDWLGRVLEKFNNLSPRMQKIVVISGAVLAAIGPVVVGLGGMVSVMAPLLAGIATVTAGLGGGVGLMGALTLLLGPLGLVVAGVVAATVAYRKWLTPAKLAKKAHKELYDEIAKSAALRAQEVPKTLEQARANLSEALSIREKIKAMIAEREEKLKSAQSVKTKTSFLKAVSPVGMGVDLAAGHKVKVYETALKDARDELAHNERQTASLNAQIKAFAGGTSTAAGAVADFTLNMSDSTKSSKDAAKAAEAAAEAHKSTVATIHQEVAANARLATALRINQREYDITEVELKMVADGFKGTKDEARKFAVELINSRDALDAAKASAGATAQEHAELSAALRDEVARNAELVAALKISQREYDITAERQRLLASGFNGTADAARAQAVEMVNSRAALDAATAGVGASVEGHARLVLGIKDEIEKNAELAAALRVSQREYDITAEQQKLVANGFKGTTQEARAMAVELVNSRASLDVVRDEVSKAEAEAEKAANGFEDMSTRAVAAFDGMAGAFNKLAGGLKSGNIIDILGGILGMLDKIGGLTGGFNIGMLSFGGARATGGPVNAGKSYLVGERGPEIFNPGQSGSITPNHKLASGGAATVKVVPSPYFNAVVDGRAAEVAKPIASGTAMEGMAQYNQNAQIARNRSLV